MFTFSKRTLSHVMSLLCLGALTFDASAAEIQQKGTHLKIQFDKDVAELIEIEGSGLGSMSISVDSGVAIEFTNVRNLSIKGGDQDDTLVIADSVEIEGNLTLKSGAGEDEMYVSGTYGKNVKVNLGDGNDTYQGDSSGAMHVGGSYSVKCGKGADNLHWEQDISVDKSMSLNEGAGRVTGPGNNHDLIMHNDGLTGIYSIGKKLSIKLAKKRSQDVELQNVSAAQLVIRGGKETNTVDLSGGGNSFGKIKLKKIETLLTTP